MSDDALTGKEKLEQFVETPAGMIAVGGGALLIIVVTLWFTGLLSGSALSTGAPFDSRKGEAEGIVGDAAADSYAAAWREQIESSMETTNAGLEQTQTDVAELRADFNKGTQKMTDSMGKVLAAVEDIKNRKPIIQQVPGQPLPSDGMPQPPKAAGIEVGEWKTIRIGGSESDIRKSLPDLSLPKITAPKKIKVPMGSFVRATLMTGASAPTEGVPWPLLFMVNRPIQGPNGQTYPAEGCMAIGQAKGHLGTAQDKILPNGEQAEVGRVEIRMSGISCDWGTVGFDQSIVGYVVDKDKQWGVEGIVRNRFPKEILIQMEAAALGGLGKALTETSKVSSTVSNATQSQTSTQLSGLLKPLAGEFLTSGTDQLKNYLTEKAKEAVSTIEIPGGIEVDFYVVKSFDMLDQRKLGAQGRGGRLYGQNGLY